MKIVLMERRVDVSMTAKQIFITVKPLIMPSIPTVQRSCLTLGFIRHYKMKIRAYVKINFYKMLEQSNHNADKKNELYYHLHKTVHASRHKYNAPGKSKKMLGSHFKNKVIPNFL